MLDEHISYLLPMMASQPMSMLLTENGLGPSPPGEDTLQRVGRREAEALNIKASTLYCFRLLSRLELSREPTYGPGRRSKDGHES